MLPSFVNFEVLEFSSLFSDAHTPFKVILERKSLHPSTNDGLLDVSAKTPDQCERINRWDKEKKEEFQNKIDIDKVNLLNEKFATLQNTVTDKNVVNDLTAELCNIFKSSAIDTFGSTLMSANKIIVIKKN